MASAALRNIAYRLLGEPEPIGELRELLELTTKAARRCAHDLQHCAEFVPKDAFYMSSAEWHERGAMWLGIFYPDRGPKDYRAKLHHEIFTLECEVARLRRVLQDHRIADEDGNIPF